mgnify:CR=1 FL=1
MGVDKFKFVSPGVFIDEIDESSVPALPERMGPLVVGRFQKGPANRPVRVDSYKEFVSTFGAASPGTATGDIWRTGEMSAPTYAAYAVQAWLRNNSPCTVFRVLGDEDPNAGTGTTAKSGWITKKSDGTATTHTNAKATAGGAYGLLIFPSGSNNHATPGTHVTGTLAAVWYVNNGSVGLKGATAGTPSSQVTATSAAKAAALIKSSNELQFTATIFNASGDAEKTAAFNFDRDSDMFIRKVFNTDPTRTNSSVHSSTDGYWLGETFESNIRNGENSKLAVEGTESSNSDTFFGAIVALEGTAGSGLTWHDHQYPAKAAATGWFISQDNRGNETSSFNPTAHTDKLFKIHALGGAGRAGQNDPGAGESTNRQYKISIQDVKPPTDKYNKFGTFTVLVRDLKDSDNNPSVLERYSSVNLNPTSANYIGRAIGDQFYDFDTTNNVVREHGDNPNRSSFVRVELSDLVKDGNASGKLPYGVYGPLTVATHEILSGSDASVLAEGSGSHPDTVTHPATGMHANDLLYIDTSPKGFFTASVVMPTARLRVSSSEGSLTKGTKAYFGFNASIKDTKRFDASNLDLLGRTPREIDPHADASTGQQYSWVFTLDDVAQSADTNHAYYASGSRADGVSWTARSGSFHVLTGSNAGYDRFTSPMFGGFDGFDITEPDPLRNSYMTSATSTTNSSFYSLKKAIDIAADADFLEYDIVAMPGITNRSLNTQLINAVEERGDALAVIDLAGNYKPPHERSTAETSNLGSVTDVVNEMKDMALNSSYGCTFYPFVKIRDTLSDTMLYVPPSVVALGTFSSSQRKSAVWFAPAGFTRGGLSEGSAGLPVVGVRQRLTSDNRDDLYEANINPIATFPAEGIVIFGQKTMQVTPSALDRINVRRLLIFLKKEISRIASRILFDQNVQATWDRFKGQVIPFLEGVQAGLGLTDFKVVLDKDTTTPDLVDRNIMYAKIFLKPARAIEFIALDFIVTRSGASFDD